MQKMTTAVRDKTAKIERKVKNTVLTIYRTYLSVLLYIKLQFSRHLSHKCYLFCRKGIIQISEILFDSKYGKIIIYYLYTQINNFILINHLSKMR